MVCSAALPPVPRHRRIASLSHAYAYILRFTSSYRLSYTAVPNSFLYLLFYFVDYIQYHMLSFSCSYELPPCIDFAADATAYILHGGLFFSSLKLFLPHQLSWWLSHKKTALFGAWLCQRHPPRNHVRSCTLGCSAGASFASCIQISRFFINQAISQDTASKAIFLTITYFYVCSCSEKGRFLILHPNWAVF